MTQHVMSRPDTPSDPRVSAVLRRYLRGADDLASQPPDADLKSLGLDSLKFVLMMLELEELLGRALFDEKHPVAVRTVGDLRLLIDGGRS